MRFFQNLSCTSKEGRKNKSIDYLRQTREIARREIEIDPPPPVRSWIAVSSKIDMMSKITYTVKAD